MRLSPPPAGHDDPAMASHRFRPLRHAFPSTGQGPSTVSRGALDIDLTIHRDRVEPIASNRDPYGTASRRRQLGIGHHGYKVPQLSLVVGKP